MRLVKAVNRPILRLLYAGMGTLLLFANMAVAQEKPKQKIGGPWWESMKQAQGMVFGDLSPRNDMPTEGDMKAAELTDILAEDVAEIKNQKNPVGNSKKVNRVIDPDSSDISSLIRQWIKMAEPPLNAKGARLKYEKWGRVYGRAISHIVKINAKPDDVNGRSPEQYVWNIRNSLDSVDHCSLGEYVTLKLEGQSLNHCKGRYKTKVVKLAGLSKTQAQKKLADMGLKTKIKLGSPAPTKKKSLTVERIIPEPGTAIARGGMVTLVLHTPFKDTRIVPLSPGNSARQAMEKIKQAGLKPKIAVVSATRPGQTGEIQSLDPPEGTELKAGAIVLVNVFGPYVKTIPVPGVTGLTKEKALRKLASAGFKVNISRTIETDYSYQSGTIHSQKPVSGTRIKIGGNIFLAVYKLSERGRAARQEEIRRSEEVIEAAINRGRKKWEAQRQKERSQAALAEQRRRDADAARRQQPQNSGKGVLNIRIPTYLTGLPLSKISAGNKTTEYSGTRGNPSQLTALLTRSKRNNEFMYTGFNAKRTVAGEYSTQNNTAIVPTITLEWLEPNDKNKRDYAGNLEVRIGCLAGKQKGKVLSSQKNNIFYLDSPNAVARVSIVFWYKERVTQNAMSEVNGILPELMAQIEPYAKKCNAR